MAIDQAQAGRKRKRAAPSISGEAQPATGEGGAEPVGKQQRVECTEQPDGQQQAPQEGAQAHSAEARQEVPGMPDQQLSSAAPALDPPVQAEGHADAPISHDVCPPSAAHTHSASRPNEPAGAAAADRVPPPLLPAPDSVLPVLAAATGDDESLLPLALALLALSQWAGVDARQVCVGGARQPHGGRGACCVVLP
jgi:hypothetical protein